MKAHAGETGPSGISMAIVGAGATGVELAAELLHAAKELAAYGLDGIKPEDVKITLIEAGPKVLPALPERISQPVHRHCSTWCEGADRRSGQRSHRRRPAHQAG